MKTKIISLLFTVMIVNGLSAQTYTLISRNNEDTIKLFSNALGKAIKNIIPGSKEESPHNFLIKKEFNGKESLLFVEFSQDEKRILTSYETDLETPGKWDTKIYTLYDIYTQLKRENAILLRGNIIGLNVEFYQRPANFQDRISIDGFEFSAPIKIAVLDETRKLAEEEIEARNREKERQRILAEQKQKELKDKIEQESNKVIIPDDAFKNIDKEDIIEAQKMSNDCYVAFLIKTNIFKQSVDRSLLNLLCDDSHIQKVLNKYDAKTLRECGKYHDNQLNVYIK